MVYVDPKNLGVLPYYHKWMVSRAEGDEKQMEVMCEEFGLPVVTGVFPCGD